MISIGANYELNFSFTQENVNDFCKVSGDFNPLHWDEAFAANTPFKKPIVHGALVNSIFSKVMGMDFPGKGSVYLKQISDFKRPIYVGLTYRAYFEVITIDANKHTAEIKTQVFEMERGKLMVDGVATVMNQELF